jgi:hypothetical protein
MDLLREVIEADLLETLEGEYRLPVVLISPAGQIISTKRGSTADLVGQIIYDARIIDPLSGENKIIHAPTVTVRITSLSVVPAPGENWLCRIPISPSYTAAKSDYVIREITDGRAFGWVQFHLIKAVQS